MKHKSALRLTLYIVLLVALMAVLPSSGIQSAAAQGGPTPIQYGQSATGTTIDINTPIVYVFSGTAGDQIIVESTSATVDTLLVLADRNATTEYARHDDLVPNQDLNARIEFTLPNTAEYLIGVFGYTAGPYTLTLNLAGGGAAPQQPQQPQQPGTQCQPQVQQGETALFPGQPATGQVIDANSPEIIYVICGNAGDQISIDLTSTVFDTYLRLADIQGNILAENDDITPNQNLNSHIDFTLPSAGDYLVGVRGYTGGPYTLVYTTSATTAPPSQPTPQPQQPQQPGGENTIAYGQTVNGTTIDINNAVVYEFTGTAGDAVSIDAVGQGVDTYLVLADASATNLAEHDDISTDNLNAHIDFVLPANGQYLIGVFGYSAGPFTLTLNRQESGSPNVPVTNQQPIGDTVTGTIDNTAPSKEFSLTGVPAGATITIDVRATSGDLDTYVALVLNGQSVAENDDIEQGNTNSYLEYQQAAAGDYTVVVTRYGGSDGKTQGNFEATIDVRQPSTVAAPSTNTPNPTASGYPAMNNTAIADWTILAYIGADNNLEGDMLTDLNEFELGGGSNERVRIVAFVDRSEEFDTSNGDWTEVHIYELGPDVSGDHGRGVPTIDSPVIANLGELDSGYGSNLADFLVWGVTNFPARHYAVEINDHGSGWVGTISDDSSEQILLIPELQQAFQAATQAAGVPKLDLIINDACLMSNIEYLAAVSPYFNYALTSSEIQLVPGFDMALLTQLLNQNPEIPMEQLGQQLIDRYFQDVQGASALEFLTGNFTDLSRFQGVVNALNTFAGAITTNPAAYATLIGQSRANAYVYATWATSDTTNVDLGHFMNQVISNSRDQQISASAQAVIDALNAQRLYSVGGSYVSQYASYYNIYFPERSADFISQYGNITPVTSWSDMLLAYYNSVSATGKATSPLDFFGLGALARSVTPRVSVTNVYPHETSVAFPTSVYMEVVGRNIAEGIFTVDQIQPDGTLVRLDSSRILTLVVQNSVATYENRWHPGVDDFVFTWEVTLPIVTDGASSHNELILLSTQDVSTLSGRYRYPGSDIWQDVNIIFDNEGRAESVITSDASANITVAVGGEFQAYRSVVTADGRVVQQPGNSYIWPEGGLTWTYAPAPSGQYNLGFLVEAFGGATGFDSTTITVNNDSANADLRGYVDLDWGFQFQFPADWFDVTYFPEQDWEQTTNFDETAYLFVYPVYEAQPDLQTIATDVLSRYEVTFDGVFTPITVAGQDALEFTFTYGEGFTARAFVVYQADLQLGLVFSAETTDGTTDSLYQTVLDTIQFFDNIAVLNQDTGVWEDDFISEETDFPVIGTWLDGFDVGGWRTYTPNADPNSQTFAKIMKTTGTDASTLLDSTLAQNVATQPDYQLVSTETYYGESYTWETATFSYTLNGQLIQGRMHVTINPADGSAYILWFEAPDAEARATFEDIFEPMLDGFEYDEQ